jgi:hypothetical protein
MWQWKNLSYLVGYFWLEIYIDSKEKIPVILSHRLHRKLAAMMFVLLISV